MTTGAIGESRSVDKEMRPWSSCALGGPSGMTCRLESRRGCFARGSAIIAAVVGLALVGCRAPASAPTTERAGALGGTITISGSILDANGLPLSGVTVHLDGTSQAVQVESGGSYAFNGLGAGSYSMRPTLNGCTFMPDVVNLNNLTASKVQSFSGSGASCGGAATVNTGATTGALTISGHVRDASGKPIVGGRITLGGAAQALRFSDFTGGYTFHVAPGTYTLAASGDCALTPANVNLSNLTASRVQDFASSAAGCVTAAASSTVASGELLTVTQRGALLFTAGAQVTTYANAAQALAALQAIGQELGGSGVRSLTIAGFPAIERQTLVPLLPEFDDGGAGGGDGDAVLATAVTTAVAMNNVVVRFGALMPDGVTAATIARFFSTGRNFTPEEAPALHGPPPVVTAAAQPQTGQQVQLPLQLTSSMVSNRALGELEIAITAANTVIYAANSGVWISPNGGGGGVFKSTLPSGVSNGDPSVAVGVPDASNHQIVYYSFIGNNNVTVLQSTSTNQGAVFSPTGGVPIDCTLPNAPCSLPDQPHMAVDRRMKSSTSNGDRIYVAWRNTVNGTANAVGISCSKDGGNTWTQADLTSVGMPGSAADIPRLDVAPDGEVYVTYESRYGCIGDGGNCSASGNGSLCCSGSCQGAGTCANRNPVQTSNGALFDISVERLSDCDHGFQRVSTDSTTTGAMNPATVVKGVHDLPAFAGLDRVPNASPYMVAADDSDLTGSRVFLTYVDEVQVDAPLTDNAPALANDDIRIAESTTFGQTWSVVPTPLNTTSQGHRFFPWICSTKGIAYVGWYDRRDATPSQTDLTAYFVSSVTDPHGTGAPKFGNELDVTGGPSFDDPECFSGFPGEDRGAIDELLCTDLPAVPAIVPGGICSPSMTQVCDLRPGAPVVCASGDTCVAGKGGPKYGDYNGIACGNGNAFMAWTSAVAPQGLSCVPQGGTCATTADCCGNGLVSCTNAVCRANGSSGCSPNGAICNATNDLCCSNNCLGGTCEPGVSIFASSTAVVPPLSCATTATPDAPEETTDFDIDTGLPPSTVGANYGQSSCPSQYLVEVDLTASAFANHSIFEVSGFWSSRADMTSCSLLQATMTVYVLDGTNTWQTWDVATYAGVESLGFCTPEPQHTNSGSVGLDVTNIPLTMGFQKARIAVNAVESGTTLAVAISGAVD
jgi:hypothetical protein